MFRAPLLLLIAGHALFLVSETKEASETSNTAASAQGSYSFEGALSAKKEPEGAGNGIFPVTPLGKKSTTESPEEIATVPEGSSPESVLQDLKGTAPKVIMGSDNYGQQGAKEETQVESHPNEFPDDAQHEDKDAYSMNKLAKHSTPTFADKLRHVDWADATDRIVRGLMKAFFHGANLQESEKKCIRTQVGSFVSDITGLATEAVRALKPVLDDKHTSRQTTPALMPVIVGGVTKLTDLVAVSTTLLKGCVKGDGILLLNQTGQHLANFTYMETRFIVAGVDIAGVLAEAIIQFEKREFYKFGEEVGIVLRKILLSTKGGAVVLPEGLPKEEVISEITEGIAAGFLPSGSQMIITDAAKPDVKVDIDLNACIVMNNQLFKEVFESLWTLCAQLAANAEQHQFGLNGTQMSGAPVWVNELLLAFMRVPTALTRCGLMDSDSEDMFHEALSTLGSIRFNFKFPDDKIQADKATEQVALAIKFFSKREFKLFGKELGKLFRGLLLLAFPSKYSVDSSGRLQRNLAMDKPLKFQQENHVGVLTLAICGVAFSLLMSLVAVKTFRMVASWAKPTRSSVDVEAGSTEDVELLE